MTPTSSSEGLKSMERTVDRQEIAVWRSRKHKKRVEFPQHRSSAKRVTMKSNNPCGFLVHSLQLSPPFCQISLSIIVRHPGREGTDRNHPERPTNGGSEAASSLPQRFAQRSSPVSFLLSSPGSSWLPSASLQRRWPWSRSSTRRGRTCTPVVRTPRQCRWRSYLRARQHGGRRFSSIATKKPGPRDVAARVHLQQPSGRISAFCVYTWEMSAILLQSMSTGIS